ncbi:MAG: UDP-3-O-(3-hydroxymyristoyl)glucosamine N-acyltransferase [Aliidongia sp.]
MADPRFFRAGGPFTVAEIAATAGAELGGAANAALRLEDVAPLESAGPHHLSFFSNVKYAEALGRSAAGAAFVHPSAAARAPAGMTLLLSTNPYLSFAKAAGHFYPRPRRPAGIAASAVIDPSVVLGAGVSIGHHVVIEAGAEIGTGTEIGHNSVVGPGVVIGRDCVIAANVTLSHCVLGDRVTLFSGVRIGQDGFGFAPDPAGHVKIPQLGRVLIGDDVEIGANSTIDRGAGPDTVIGAGSMIDNLVQIGHNVVLGRGCILAAQVGISGSAKLGDFVALGGQVGLAGHLSIGTGAQLVAQSGVMRDVPPGTDYAGTPAVPRRQWLRQTAILDRLATKKDR